MPVNAVPLLILAVLYGLLSVLLGVSMLRERRASVLGVGIWLLFTVVAALSALLAGLALAGNDPLDDEPSWLVIVSAVAVAIPGALVLLRGHDRALLVTARRRVREAEELATERGREAEAISRLSSALSSAQTGEEAAASLFDEVEAVLAPDALMLAHVDPELGRATGLASRGVDEGWWRSVDLDLGTETSVIATVVRERAPVAILDLLADPRVNRSLAEAAGAKSAAFVPLFSEGDVVGVLIAASTAEQRDFGGPELDLVQGLAGEAALALGRTSSGEALRAALERERLVAEIGRRVRSELDLTTVLRVAVEESAKALGGVTRCFVRLGELGESMPVLAEWNAPGVGPVGESAPNLPAMNLAARDRRTVAVGDVEASEEIGDPSLGGARSLLDLGTKATVATPILFFGELIGVFSLHRAEPSRWLPGEIAFAEAVARELGVAIHTARLLGENERRLRRQETLIEAAQVLTSDLRFESVIRRLVEEVVSLTGADAADCWTLEPDGAFLRCRAVVGVPEWNVGRQIPPEGTIGRALRSGTVLTHEFAQTEDPPPSPAYAVFSDVLATPITWQGEARGVLGVCTRERGRLDGGDIEVVEAFARFASLALHNAESFEERERQSQAQRGFYRIAQVLGSTLSRAQTLDALAQAACEALGGDAALVLELADEEAVLAGTHELPESVSAALDGERGRRPAWPFGGPGAGQVLASTELNADDRFDEALRLPLLAEGYGALLCAPVVGVRDQAYAVAVLFRGGRAFTDEDVLLTQHLSGAAQGALERSELFEGERRGRTFSQRVAHVGALLATSLDPAVVLGDVAGEAPGLLGADAAVIRVLEGDQLVVRAASGPGTERLLGASAGSGSAVSGAVAQSRETLAVADVREQPRLVRGDQLLERGTAACVAVPLSAHGGGVHGVLAVYSTAPRAWRDDEVQALAALGAVASASIANAELYQRVAEEKERGGAILANIADGIVAVGRNDRIVLWNAMAEQITGVPASETLGRTVPEVLQRELAGDEAEPERERHLAIRRGGEEVWVALTEAVMLDPAGTVAGRVFAFRDISRERVVEEMKSEFVNAVSHELRTPLTSIYGFAETLLRGELGFDEAERETFLRYIGSESERLIRIVDDLLSVARLEAGTLAVALAPIDVGEAARAAVAAADEQSGGFHRFDVDVEPADLTVRADREKLGQVLSNLLDNAVRYSPEGGIITVAARTRGTTAEITVSDEGMGINPTDRQRIFAKFFRAERVLSAQGTGLGLFLVRGLVTAMGGRIWVDSEEGRGSRFTFELPLDDRRPVQAVQLEAAS